MPTGSSSLNNANLNVWDISGVPDAQNPVLIAQGNWVNRFENGGSAGSFGSRLALHSMDVSADGTRIAMAWQRGHTLLLDSSEVVAWEPGDPIVNLSDDLLTNPLDRPTWGSSTAGCQVECAESHSSELVPGRNLILNTDEVYGTATLAAHGCPWGWVHLIDTADPAQIFISAEYKTTKNACPADDLPTQQRSSWASHNPTVTPHLALLTWHAAGFHVIDLTDPTAPAQVGWYSPTPLESVATEDPNLGGGNAPKVLMWSYPIVDDGLIYVVDIRNGFYVLRYTGPGAFEIDGIDFLEGNSNQGDLPRFDNAPVVDPVADITVEATGPAGATVSFASPAALDQVDGPLATTCDPASGSTFPLGTTTVTCSATDGEGFTGVTQFDVTVLDTTPPTLTIPAAVTANATMPSGAVVTFATSATDIVDGTVPVSCVPPSGSLFGIGDTTVNCSATDAAGNTQAGSFNVHVAGAAEQLSNLLAAVGGVGAGTSLADKVETMQADLAAGDLDDLCNDLLRSWQNSIGAQAGKKIPAGTASSLQADGLRIADVLACD
jgi:hypothetical protein